MKIKIVEKRNIFVSLFAIFYLIIFMALSTPIMRAIEKYVFKYEKPILPPDSLINPLPNKVELYSFVIYLFVAIIIYLVVLRLIKIKNE